MGSFYLIIFILFFDPFSFSLDPELWSEDVAIPQGGRENPYQLSKDDWRQSIARGQIHAQKYPPIEVTGILLPKEPLAAILDNDTWNPLKAIINQAIGDFSGFESFDDVFRWLGLVEYPRETDPAQFQIAWPDTTRPEYRLGYSDIDIGGVKAFTMSCAACHSDQLFGQTVFGMSKRFSRANEFFLQGQNLASSYNAALFQFYAGATDAEVEMMNRSLKNLNYVAIKKPKALGLDTSLAQVALSLKKRAETPWAEKLEALAAHPRPDILDYLAADSKPAVWWNVKYKNRWLSDGSVVAGNPLFTNILWNEIGRGTDLKELSAWLQTNDQVIQDLTSVVFANEAPRWEDFFPAEKLSRDSVLRGQKVFESTCARCHGHYIKNWELAEYQNQPWKIQIKTHQVVYHTTTPVVDVGTDSSRWQGMKSLEDLNKLAISQQNGILVRAQQGYVPPPLVGIWARWPYLHNNSIPSLCGVLLPAEQRPKFYFSGAPLNQQTDFDVDCNGYPIGDSTPEEWRESDHYFDTSIQGLSNLGHDREIFIINGKNILSSQDRMDLIRFLQTL